ncbi:MAG: xanthine dehydrogenase small subunit [Pseudomonadota bacterium]
MMRGAIRFLRRGQIVEVSNLHPRTTLLDWLRLEERSTGTKEGCGEGDCGACTVVLARVRGGKLTYEPVNACILLLGQVDGAEVITVEDLANGTALHPVQEAMVASHGSQCGYCTPGIIMSLFALYQKGQAGVDRTTVNDALAGNLCRCTGYRPIVEAAIEACAGPANDTFSVRAAETARQLMALQRDEDLFVGSEACFFAAPRTESALSMVMGRHPDARLVAGATDVGLWITKGLQSLDKIIWLGRVDSLATLENRADEISIGATVTHSRALPLLATIDSDLGEIGRRFGSTQVRASGTVVGNIANGSPIGDWPPAFIALGATVELRKGFTSRILLLEDYFVEYRKQALEPGEFVRRITVQKLGPDDHARFFKVSKRRDEDISSVMGAFRITVVDGTITGARIAYGGMAGTPKRATSVENAILGQSIMDIATWRAGSTALEHDFAPLSDHRASSVYRMQVGRNLVIKALAEIAGVPTNSTRISGIRESIHDVA